MNLIACYSEMEKADNVFRDSSADTQVSNKSIVFDVRIFFSITRLDLTIKFLNILLFDSINYILNIMII